MTAYRLQIPARDGGGDPPRGVPPSRPVAEHASEVGVRQRDPDPHERDGGVAAQPKRGGGYRRVPGHVVSEHLPATHPRPRRREVLQGPAGPVGWAEGHAAVEIGRHWPRREPQVSLPTATGPRNEEPPSTSCGDRAIQSPKFLRSAAIAGGGWSPRALPPARRPQRRGGPPRAVGTRRNPAAFPEPRSPGPEGSAPPASPSMSPRLRRRACCVRSRPRRPRREHARRPSTVPRPEAPASTAPNQPLEPTRVKATYLRADDRRDPAPDRCQASRSTRSASTDVWPGPRSTGGGRYRSGDLHEQHERVDWCPLPRAEAAEQHGRRPARDPGSDPAGRDPTPTSSSPERRGRTCTTRTTTPPTRSGTGLLGVHRAAQGARAIEKGGRRLQDIVWISNDSLGGLHDQRQGLSRRPSRSWRSWATRSRSGS